MQTSDRCVRSLPSELQKRATMSFVTMMPVDHARLRSAPPGAARVRRCRGRRAARLDFAFASGGAAGALESLLDARVASPSSWDPAVFADDLFVDDLIASSFRRKGGATPSAGMRTLLSRPPSDLSTIHFRQAIVRELDEKDGFSRELEQVHDALGIVLALLGPQEVVEDLPIAADADPSSDPRQLSSGWRRASKASSSGLERVSALGRSIVRSEAFARLGRLLDLEGNLAGLDVRLRVASDGKLRAFDIVQIEENPEESAYYTSPLRRLLGRISRLLRGYRFTDSEVLEGLVDGIFTGIRADLARALAMISDARFYLGVLAFARRARARGLAVCLPTLAPPDRVSGATRAVDRLFNPLLLGASRAPVPCDLELAPDGAVAIFTGPNSGGKTRVLQALGITQMLAQAGSFVPAEKAELVVTDDMFISLIDHEHAEQGEGRLGLELQRIREVFERARPRAIVMIDELCAGTNPSEGEEIFETVTSLLTELAPQAFITTHFLDFAARLEARKLAGFEFFCVELDAEDEPTYQFRRGVATSSLARKTAERLGVTREALEKLVAKARKNASRERPAQNGKVEPGGLSKRAEAIVGAQSRGAQKPAAPRG